MKLLYSLLVLSLCGTLTAQVERQRGAQVERQRGAEYIAPDALPVLQRGTQYGSQAFMQSGSFHFVYADNHPVTLTLEGVQNFQETISDELIISNLMPGEYLLTVGLAQRGKVILLKQPVEIPPATRVDFKLSENGKHATSTYPDRNSVPLAIFKANEYNNAGQNNGGQTIPDADFARILDEVGNEGFEDQRLKAIKVNTGFYKYLTARQARALAELFSFESNRLACLLDLAPKVIDRANLPSLADILSFKSNKDQYFDFLLKLQNGN
ncbi:MAG: DUF4476 domain-containing protein [Tannerella sp.]|jgi:hypothetical protein|nr:DUF4476 domain-containing protein [Tannerella sp.]